MLTPLTYALLVLGALCGYLTWRASGKLLHSTILALAVPLTVLGVIRLVVAGESSESFLKTVLLLGVIIALGALVYMKRGE